MIDDVSASPIEDRRPASGMLRSFVKDLAKYSPAQFLPAITAFITTPIMTRLLLPAEYGYWGLAAGIYAFLGALAVSGFGSAVIRFYPAYKARQELNIFYSTSFIFVGIVLIAVAAVGVGVVLLLERLRPSALVQLLPLVVLIFVAQSIFTVFVSVVRAQERGGLFSSFQLLMHYGSLGLGLLLVAVCGLGVKGLLWGTLLATVLSLPPLVFLTTRGVSIRPRYFHGTDARQIWQYAWPLLLSNTAMWGLRTSDLFIIGLSWSEHDVGIYSVAYYISAKSVELLVGLFLLSVSPLVYRTWETEGQKATETTVTMVTRVYLLLCLPAVVGLSVLAYPFMVLLTAPDYYEGHQIVGVVALSSFMWGLGNIAMLGLAIKKKARRLAFNTIIAACVHVSLQLFLVPRFGYIAAALSTVIGYTFLLVLQTLASWPYLTWRFPFSTLRNVIAASAVMGLVAWEIYRVSEAIIGILSVRLVTSIAVAVSTYIMCLWLLGEVKDGEKQMACAVWRRLKGRVAL